MERYIKLVLKWPKAAISIIILITIILSLGIPSLTFDSSVDVMMPREDTHIGNAILRKIRSSDAPSISALSKKSFGVASKNDRSTRIENACPPAIYGIISPPNLLSRPRDFVIMNAGTSVRILGIMSRKIIP